MMLSIICQCADVGSVRMLVAQALSLFGGEVTIRSEQGIQGQMGRVLLTYSDDNVLGLLCSLLCSCSLVVDCFTGDTPAEASREHIESRHSSLRHERERRGWSQSRLAEEVGVTPYTISRWELGKASPYPIFQERLFAIFEMNPFELGLIEAS